MTELLLIADYVLFERHVPALPDILPANGTLGCQKRETDRAFLVYAAVDILTQTLGAVAVSKPVEIASNPRLSVADSLSSMETSRHWQCVFAMPYQHR